MFTRRFLSSISLAIAVSAAVTTIVPPISQGQWNEPSNAVDLDGTYTDASTITSTATDIDQKSSPPSDVPPNQPVADTVVTAVDGQIVDADTKSTTRRRGLLNPLERFAPRSPSDYERVFLGTGTDPTARDASISGTAYLTYTLVSNATYNVDDCLAACDRVDQCVFVNLFYEFNNELLDFVFSEKSNLKCALYGDVHTAAEKTNFGGQQSEPAPASLIYIQQSSGYSAIKLVDPPVPDGYENVFGPTDGANNAPGYMGFVFLDRYDVDACAQQCNARDADPSGGACQYFNIWRALVDGKPTTYTCSMYFIPTDASTAVNTGQGDLQVTFSRGYKRKNYVPDGGFEGFMPQCPAFCFSESYANWIGTSPAGGFYDATIFYFQPYAHSGHGSCILGSGAGVDNLPGTITHAQPLQTVAGRQYTICFFLATAFSGPNGEADAFVEILWNGVVVSTIRPGYTNWKFYSVGVDAVGNDSLAFTGGGVPDWVSIDDVAVYEV